MDICWSAVNLESCSGGCNWCPQRRFWRRGAFDRCWYEQQALLLLVKPSMAALGGRGSGGKGKHWGWQRNSVERQHGNTLLGKVAPSKAVVLSNTFILEWQHERAGFLSSHAYEQPLLSWAFLSGVLCGAGKSVRISSFRRCLFSKSHPDCGFLKCFLKKSPALDKSLYLRGKGELSTSALYGETDTWTCRVPVPWIQVTACWDSDHHLCFCAPSSPQNLNVPFLFQRDFSDFKVLLMKDFIASYFSAFSAEIRLLSTIFRMISSCLFCKGFAAVKLRIQYH